MATGDPRPTRADIQARELAQWLAAAARELDAVNGEDATGEQVCQVAVDVIAGCRSAGISEDGEGRCGQTLAASDETARLLHDLQHELGEGPCMGAIRQHRVVWVDDLADDDRWPRFAEEAVAHGVRSMVAIQLYTRSDTYGALNLYSHQVGAFDEVTRDVAQIYAAHATTALAAARNNAQMSRALTTRQQIGQATGILAERHKVTTDEAFAMLVRSSTNNNIKLRDLAARLVTNEDENRRRSR